MDNNKRTKRRSSDEVVTPKELIKTCSITILITFLLAASTILYVNNKDKIASALNKDETPVVQEETFIKYPKDLSYAIVTTTPYTKTNDNLRSYLKDKSGEIISTISIVTLKEDGSSIELQEIPNVVQANFPSQNLNDQIKYITLTETKDSIKETINKFTGKEISSLAIVDEKTLITTLKNYGVTIVGMNGTLKLDDSKSSLSLNTPQSRAEATRVVLDKLFTNSTDFTKLNSILGFEVSGDTVSKYKEIKSIREQYVAGNLENFEKLAPSHREILEKDKKVELSVKYTAPTLKEELIKDYLKGVSNVPSTYLNNKLVYIDESLDHNLNIIIQKYKN